MFTLTFTCTRPNISVPFFHDSLSGVDAMSALTAVRNATPSLVYSNTLSPDELTYVGVYEFSDSSADELFMLDLIDSYPTFYDERDTYYALHGHTMDVVFGF